MAKDVKRLGKGLGALLDGQTVSRGPVAAAAAATAVAATGGGDGEEEQPAEAPAAVKSALVKEIPLSQIAPNPQQPRSKFDEESLEELANSIKQLGIIQPVTVRVVDTDRYQIISGERRYRASKMLGYEAIPAYVREANDSDSLLMALIENIQRTDLDAMEVALSYQRLVDELSLTQEEISEKVGKKRSTVANYLRLLKLPDEIQRAIRDQLISMGHARALVNVSGVMQQVSIAKKIVEQGLSVRQVEELVKQLDKPKAEKNLPLPDDDDDSEKISEPLFKLVESMEKYFNGKVNIKRGANGGAKLTIDLKTDDDVKSAVDRMSQLVNDFTA
ncbi:MAG: ParB/RepB/Spo0J family partition protein [Prevotellaceae bacterium]|jgi:ParB family chromosome partitioning protein|nr:ParB/RepB/Spo0J family partition protein [Prevotellaceae bacterium]